MKAQLKAFGGGMVIGAVTRLVIGSNPAAIILSSAAAFVWGSYCAWDGLSAEEKELLRKAGRDLVKGTKPVEPVLN